MDFIKLTQEKLSVEEAMESVTASNCGAVSLFVGTTRDNFEGKKVLTLEYEAYESMAQKAMKEICVDIRKKWTSVENIAIHHRLGRVQVKEASVVLAISSPHRADAMQATQWCIDTLKKTVPIWKKEVYEETEAQWKENSECDWSQSNKAIPQLKLEVEYSNVPSHLIQITCTNDEIKRRIDTFMQRAREQNNRTNTTDYCGTKNRTETCARIDAVLIRQANSKSHLKMDRVYNGYGPVKVTNNKSPYISSAVEQRLSALENCLEISKPVAPDIYQRLKQMEDRILYLESISPEYSHFWNKTDLFGMSAPEIIDTSPKKRKYTTEDIDKCIFELEQTYSKSATYGKI